MSFEEQTQGFTPQQRLATFIWAVYQDLNSIVALRYELFDGPIYRDFLNALAPAWEEVYRQRVDVLGAVLSSDLSTLGEAGLSGSQLIAKLKRGMDLANACLTSSRLAGQSHQLLRQRAHPSAWVGYCGIFDADGHCTANVRSSGWHACLRMPTIYSTAWQGRKSRRTAQRA